MKHLAFLLIALILMVTPALADNTFIPDYRAAGFASKAQDVVTDTQFQADYSARTDGQPVYLGYAVKGKATSDDAWMVYKFTYDVNNQCTIRQTAYGVWTNRASLTYK